MLQNIKQTRGGFTLVEIMIVVAIIALLATLAGPNILRARQRSQAAAIKQDLRLIDAAIDQLAIEKNLGKSGTFAVSDLKAYVKENSSLYTMLANNAVKDALSNAITIPTTVGGTVGISQTTYTDLLDVTGTDYWKPYASGT